MSSTPPPQPTPLYAALRYLGPRDRALLLAGERTNAQYTSAGGGGPMQLSYRCSSKGIEISHYTDAEWAGECAWHLYWRAQGGYVTLDPELAAGAPPRPPSPSKRTSFTWAELRRMLKRHPPGSAA